MDVLGSMQHLGISIDLIGTRYRLLHAFKQLEESTQLPSHKEMLGRARQPTTPLVSVAEGCVAWASFELQRKAETPAGRHALESSSASKIAGGRQSEQQEREHDEDMHHGGGSCVGSCAISFPCAFSRSWSAVRRVIVSSSNRLS